MNKQQIELAIRTSNEKCLFTEEFAIGLSIRSMPLDKKGKKLKKEGVLKVFFFDAVTQKVISELALTSISARHLAQGLMKNVLQLEKDLKDTKPKKKVKQAKPHYTG